MKRIIDYFLLEWKDRQRRKPLLLRGARQVGKTYSVRKLGQSFSSFIEINLELNSAVRIIMEREIDPVIIIRQLSEYFQEDIIPGKTLLFIDEIQVVPQAILALRYFYEKYPDLHVIAAGSLLDFAIEQVGIPVGRVSSLYMYPMSFVEFLLADSNPDWIKLILEKDSTDLLSKPLHDKLLQIVGEYIAIGGMPEAVGEWIKNKNSRMSKIVHSDLIDAYQQDFGKYAKKYMIKYLNIIFSKAMNQLGGKFMYSKVGEYKKRELEPALDLVETAGLFHKILKSSGQGIPLGAQVRPDDFKLIFFDVGLSQALLGLDITNWFIDNFKCFINRGEIVEAFVGQEILAYSDPIAKSKLFYWRRDVRGSSSEVDYLIQLGNKVLPIEVKSGKSKWAKSLKIFLELHKESPYGMRFYAENYNKNEQIHSYPLYAVIKPFVDAFPELKKALEFLIRDRKIKNL